MNRNQHPPTGHSGRGLWLELMLNFGSQSCHIINKYCVLILSFRQPCDDNPERNVMDSVSEAVKDAVIKDCPYNGNWRIGDLKMQTG